MSLRKDIERSIKEIQDRLISAGLEPVSWEWRLALQALVLILRYINEKL